MVVRVLAVGVGGGSNNPGPEVLVLAAATPAVQLRIISGKQEEESRDTDPERFVELEHRRVRPRSNHRPGLDRCWVHAHHEPAENG